MLGSIGWPVAGSTGGIPGGGGIAALGGMPGWTADPGGMA